VACVAVRGDADDALVVAGDAVDAYTSAGIPFAAENPEVFWPYLNYLIVSYVDVDDDDGAVVVAVVGVAAAAAAAAAAALVVVSVVLAVGVQLAVC
jgi:hypothetical protein